MFYFSYKTSKFAANLYPSGQYIRREECEKARERLKQAGFFVTAIHQSKEKEG